MEHKANTPATSMRKSYPQQSISSASAALTLRAAYVDVYQLFEELEHKFGDQFRLSDETGKVLHLIAMSRDEPGRRVAWLGRSRVRLVRRHQGEVVSAGWPGPRIRRPGQPNDNRPQANRLHGWLRRVAILGLRRRMADQWHRRSRATRDAPRGAAYPPPQWYSRAIQNVHARSRSTAAHSGRSPPWSSTSRSGHRTSTNARAHSRCVRKALYVSAHSSREISSIGCVTDLMMTQSLLRVDAVLAGRITLGTPPIFAGSDEPNCCLLSQNQCSQRLRHSFKTWHGTHAPGTVAGVVAT